MQEVDWEFDGVADNGVGGAVERSQRNWGDVMASELMFRYKRGVEKAVGQSRVNKGINFGVWSKV